MAIAVDTFSSLSMVRPSPATGLPPGAATDLIGVAAAAASVTLATVQARYRARYAEFSEPRKERLLDHALRSIDPATSGVYLPVSQVEYASLLLRELIADAQPTPQIAVDEGGVIEALWLVNGTEVTLSIEPDGSGVLAASAPEEDYFEYEFDDVTDPLDLGKIAEARIILNELGELVTHRVLV